MVSYPNNCKASLIIRDIFKFISFSTIPSCQTAPPSSPPCPGSIITSGLRIFFCALGATKVIKTIVNIKPKNKIMKYIIVLFFVKKMFKTAPFQKSMI